ncbi:MAG: retropepsin-like aspartic protease [Clostridiales bacterium]
MNIIYRDGLLFTSINIEFRGKSKVITNMVIDTGAAQTLISQESVNELGLVYENDDMLVSSKGIGGIEYSFVKRIDKINLGSLELIDFDIDFTGYIDYDINGLLGLDLLILAGLKIDLEKFRIRKP